MFRCRPQAGGYEAFHFCNNAGKWGILMKPAWARAVKASERNFTNNGGKWGDSRRWGRKSIPLPVRRNRLTYVDSLPTTELEDLKEKIADLGSKSLYELLTRCITRGTEDAQCRITGGALKVPTISQVLSSLQHIYSQKTLCSNLGAPKLVSSPGRPVRSLRPCSLPFVLTKIWLIQFMKKVNVLQEKNCPSFYLDPTSLNSLFWSLLLGFHSLPEEDLHWSTSAECWCSSTSCSFEHVTAKVSR